MSGAEGPAVAQLVGGRYELEALLGKGGMGEVWRARHVTLETHFAIKLLHGRSARSDSMRRRFVNEARVAAQLKTRYAVQVFDFGITDDGQPYLVMELLEGETLGRRIRRVKHLSSQETVRFLSQAARALERAHSFGIVHRDFKPENILVVSDDETLAESIKVLDFGVAKLVRDLAATAHNEIDADALDAAPLTSFTCTGSLLGTPCYMAPEQTVGAPDLDLRADIWALGVVAFECLTGQTPFAGATLTELFANIQRGKHARATAIDPALPASVDAWFDVACAPNPGRRFASAAAAAAELAVALDVAPVSGMANHADSPRTSRPASDRPLDADTETPVTMRTAVTPPPPAALAGPTLGSAVAFHAPVWDAPLDVQACIDAIPPDATLKGLFSIPMITDARRRGIALKLTRERYLPFFAYPLAEHVELMVQYARAVYPEVSIRQALRKVGWRAYASFLGSLVGKVVWSSVDTVLGGLAATTKAYAISSPASRVRIVESGAGRALVRLEGIHYFLDSNHVGVFEGILRGCKAHGTVLVRTDSPTSGEFLITWA